MRRLLLAASLLTLPVSISGAFAQDDTHLTRPGDITLA